MKRSTVLSAVLACLLSVWTAGRGADELRSQSVQIDGVSVGGVVLNTSGRTPEAGVWVIAETSDLPTRFRRIVVTDELGRFVLPDLPEASYRLWVRGYGLSDSTPVAASRGQQVTLDVVDAATPQAAAQIYPANYWLSLYHPPQIEAVPDRFTGQDHWIAQMKLNCMLCHQLGARPTRSQTTPEAWEAAFRLTGMMPTSAVALGADALTQSLADWGSRIAAGELPPTPPRPVGVERNIVVTQWEWGRPDSYIHDEISTDKRNPTLYPYGRVWGVDLGQDFLWALDPMTHTVSSYKVPTRNGYSGRWGFGSWEVYSQVANPHNPMMDDKGNVWMTTQVRGEQDYPPWVADVIVDVAGSGRQSVEQLAADWAEGGHHRQLGYFDPSTEAFVLIDTAFGTHHLQFDADGRLWTSLDSAALGMFDPAAFDPDRPLETEQQAQRAWVDVDEQTGRSTAGGGYGIIVSPVDGTVWRAHVGSGGARNKIDRFDPTAQTFTDYSLPTPGRGPRGIDAATDGSIWFATGSGHLGRFDPQAEAFTYWETPGPKLHGTGDETGSADFHYYLWVDQFNTFGLGTDIVIVNGTNSDSLIAFDPATEQFTMIRMPFPIGMFSRGLDGRIDDVDAGWKGRGLWVNYGSDPITHIETQMGAVNHIQLRPNPLAY